MEYFKIGQGQRIVLPLQSEKLVLPELLANYTPGVAWDVSYADTLTVTAGQPVPCALEDGEYIINVTQQGAAIHGRDYDGLVRGFVTFLEMIFCYGRDDYRVECGTVIGSSQIPFRSVHICLFPEYSFEAIRRTVRTCGMAKYTHIFLETWGSIQLDSLKQLSWQNAFTKQQVRQLVREANVLGMKVIPFFQHLGHASMARLSYSGKHTLLDQDPRLEYLYYPKSYGWVWNFKSPEVKALLKNIREELMDLFGEAEYFHLGCDESGLEFDPKELCDYLNEVSDDLKAKGRRAIIWGDMMLSHDFFPEKEYECNSSAEYANALARNLSKDIIIADWQYNIKSESWASSRLLKERGFDVICCPWDEDDNLNASLATVKNDGHLGVMKTTWNRLFSGRGIPSIVYYGLYAHKDESFKRFEGHVGLIPERAHTIFRKVLKGTGAYEDAGWAKNQIE